MCILVHDMIAQIIPHILPKLPPACLAAETPKEMASCKGVVSGPLLLL